ncbi:membrane-associated tyrosine- and threonine-specific cdc2-inhibitory kinase isoform X2 [Osmerus mordax]|uniref:membrane-associated tyrosine- and threonine-specific cdc2-inhibitory kinase isoform X2 n=1 Tax=Osmerus mordax TaxID=8014 RepID=UPI0035101BB8
MSVSLETKMATTPLPLPAHFSQAEQSFSVKKRCLLFSSSSTSSLSPPALHCHSLPPRPPSKGCPPLSRVFPQRPPSPWTPLSRSLLQAPPQASLYDPSKPKSFFSQCFTNLGLLGRGSFGEVYKVLSLLDGRHYAVKRSVQRFRGTSERNRSVREARSHERLCPHPHILGFVAAWEEGGRLYIQTELCCTTLLLHAEAQPPCPDEPAVWAYLCDLLAALQHLHSQGYAHLDLKPANVFLTRSGRLKLGDFGLLLELPGWEGGAGGTGRQGGRSQETQDPQEGDPRYMAPELLRGEYSPAADVFSLGVSILELVCNMEVPKGGEGWQQLRQGCLPSQFTSGLSGELQAVLQMMLSPEPCSRASVATLLSLPVIRRRRWRRWASLLLREAMLTLLSLCQSVVSSCWGLLSRLPLPGWGSSAPSTPPRSRGDSQLTLPPSVMLTDAGSLDDDLELLPGGLDLELSPTFSHRVKSRLSAGSTSTPLPAAPPSTPPHSRHLHTPTHSLTHTPYSIHSYGSPVSREPSLTLEGCQNSLSQLHPSRSSRSPSQLHPSRSSRSPSQLHPSRSSRSPSQLHPSRSSRSPSQLHPSRSSRSSCRPGRNWVIQEPLPRPSFEPKNLLSLFDDTAVEGQP